MWELIRPQGGIGSLSLTSNFLYRIQFGFLFNIEHSTVFMVRSQVACLPFLDAFPARPITLASERLRKRLSSI
jgi:hypothetical protein